MARRDRTYDDALRAAFGRVTNITPAQAREAADRYDQKAVDAGPDRGGVMFERAEQLREWADQPHLDTDDSSSSSEPAPAASPSSSSPPRSKRGSSSTGNRTMRAAARAASPDRQVASAVRSGSSLVWSVLAGGVALILVFQVVTRADAASLGVQQLEQLVKRVVYPRGAFPDGPPTSSPPDAPPTGKRDPA